MTDWLLARSESRRANDFSADDFIFFPDMVLSGQYFANSRDRAMLEAEQKLMLAILEDAVKCYQDNLLNRSRRGRRLFAEAESWIAEGGSDWIFSFDNVCESLGFNPEYVRRGLVDWKERSRQGEPPVGWEKQRAAG